MMAVLLCAGFATRMYPLTRDFPKPLLEVAHKPVIDYLMDQLLRLPGLNAVHIVSNAKFYKFFVEWQAKWKQEGRLQGCTLYVHNNGVLSNDKRLGACADLQLGLHKAVLKERALVSAGDNIYRFDLKPLWERFVQSNAHYVVALPEYDRQKLTRTGVLSLDPSDRVFQMVEKPSHPDSSWCCPPLYFLQPSAIPRLNEFLQASTDTDAPGHFIDFLCRREPVYAFRLNASRLDIGSPASYEAADRELRSHPPCTV